MNKVNQYPRGTYAAIVKTLRKNHVGRYVLIVELEQDDFRQIEIDINDSLLETSGLYKLNRHVISRIKSNLPNQIIVSNIRGYWRIENESQFLSDIFSNAF